jgi:hypothetical protein
VKRFRRKNGWWAMPTLQQIEAGGDLRELISTYFSATQLQSLSCNRGVYDERLDFSYL